MDRARTSAPIRLGEGHHKPFYLRKVINAPKDGDEKRNRVSLGRRPLLILTKRPGQARTTTNRDTETWLGILRLKKGKYH